MDWLAAVAGARGLTHNAADGKIKAPDKIFFYAMNLRHAKLTEGGRIVIPAQLRKQLGLNIGDEVLLELDDHELRLRSLDSAIKRAQGTVRRYVDKNAQLSNELIEDRRREAADD